MTHHPTGRTQALPAADGGTSGHSFWFVAVVSLFITCLITANIISVKLMVVFGRVLPAGIVIFPLSYITADVLTEVYGFARARQAIWLGFFCNLIVVAAVWLGQEAAPAPFWDGQRAYETILGYTPRLLAASFSAYLVGEFFNAFIMAKMKIATRGKWLWSRTITSTLVGQGLDSMVFLTLAFWGVVPPPALVQAVVVQWLVKCAYEAAATPLTYLSVRLLKRREGLDVYDDHTRFTPLSVRG